MAFFKRCGRRLKHFRRALSLRGLILLPVIILLTIIIICGLVYGIYILIKNNREKFYCPEEYCPLNKKPISCHHPAEWNTACDNPKEIKFTSEMKTVVTEKINDYRNQFAGNLYFKPYRWCHEERDDYTDPESDEESVQFPCTRCQVIDWDNNLEYLAQLSNRFCGNSTEQNYCFNNFQFPEPEKLRESRHARPYHEWIEQTVNTWASESDSPEQRMLINEKTTHVGCAMILTTRYMQRYIDFTCFFNSKEALKGRGPHFLGRGGTECRTGVDFRYKYLCAGNENIDNQLRPNMIGLKESEKPYGLLYNDKRLVDVGEDQERPGRWFPGRLNEDTITQIVD